jgi:tetratricopeptide (TPR) repeat protein
MLARLRELAHDDPELVYETTHAHAFRLLREERLEEALGELLACADVVGAAPDRAYACWVNLACIAGALGRFDEALAHAECGLRAVRGLPPLAAPLHAVRATLLARLDRFDEARAALAEERRVAERSGSEGLLALADHDEGMVAALAGEHARAAELLGSALEGGAAVSRPLARLARAEALARDGRADEADAELRAVTLEPVGPADRPRLLVPRLTHVQALVALARGDRALAARRLDEAVAAWRRTSDSEQAGELLANLVDLGRPSVGVTEPARELARAEAERRQLEAMTI